MRMRLRPSTHPSPLAPRQRRPPRPLPTPPAATPSTQQQPLPCPLLGVHQLTFIGQWDGPSAAGVAARAAKAGFGMLELNLSVPADVLSCLPETRDALQASGLVAAGSLGLSPATDIGSDDAEIRAAGLAILRGAVDAVAGLRPASLSYFCGVNYSAIAKYASGLSRSQRSHVIVSLKEATAYAADAGVGWGLEVINRYETNVLNTVAQAHALIDDLGAPPGLGIHIDTYHANIEEVGGPAGAVGRAGGRLGYVHVGESHRGHLGTGSVAWAPFFDALVGAGYAGPLTFESFSSAVVSPTLSNALCVWRDLWDDSDELAASAASFMRAEWDAAVARQAKNV